jgi:hypothetical protein
MRLTRLIIAVCSLAAVTFGAPAAGAAVQRPADECPIQVGIYPGVYKCGTRVGAFTWFSDHREEYFVVGTNGVVYHIWQRSRDDQEWSGWYPMAGSNNVVDGVDVAGPHDNPTVWVTGGDGHQWYTNYTDAGWAPWACIC